MRFLQKGSYSRGIQTTACTARWVGKQYQLKFKQAMKTDTDWKSLYKIVS